jgi:hypothetical protein
VSTVNRDQLVKIMSIIFFTLTHLQQESLLYVLLTEVRMIRLRMVRGRGRAQSLVISSRFLDSPLLH